ncbi:MAG TPA: prolyl oligopeptidase family serine peptidase [Gemmatimonadaceae bacterium]
MALTLAWAAASMGFVTSTSLAQGSAKPRPMEVEDLFRSERVVDVVSSPDGSLVAIVVRRAATSQEHYQQGVLTEGHADIWLVRTDGTGRRNLTNGARDATGYWMPSWSPDGEHLAMLSTKGGGGVRAYVWSRRNDALKRVAEANVDLTASADPSGTNWNNHPFAWVSQRELAVMFVPSGTRSWVDEMLVAGTHAAMAAWPKAERGVEPTVSVLETGPGLKQTLRSGTLTLVDVVSDRSRTVAEIPMEQNSSGLRYFVLSPSRRYAMVLTSERREIDPTQRRLTRSQSRFRIGIVDLDPSRPGVRWVDSVSAVVTQTLEHVIRWSPHDSTVAVLARRTSDLDGPPRLYAIAAGSALVSRLLPDDWDTSNLEITAFGTPLEQAGITWRSDDRPVVYARPSRSSAHDSAAMRLDWWLIDGARGLRNVTAAMPVVPTSLSRTADPRLLVGLADGRVWTLDVELAKARSIAPGLSRVRRIVWPARRDLPVATPGRLIVDVGVGHNPELHEVDLGTGDGVRRVAVPPQAGGLVDYVSSRSLAVFTDSTSRVIATQAGSASTLLSINANLPPIERPVQRLITYRGIDGDTLSGVLVLPNEYVSGKRYPLITRVYAGLVFHDTLSLTDALNTDLMLYAAHGYAVLVPSMPLKPTNLASDPYNDIPKGVIPAVDRVIELGIADPARLGVTGLSYGGYSTYALITSTTRFRAAIAEVGPADLISFYGVFRVTDRYRDDPYVTLSNAKMLEGGQFRMGVPPWSDLWRYLKNSPFYYLDRVETPLLIIQGDQDITGTDQIEGIFTALHRFGKRAQLARYWGEWHGLDSPANIRDAWQRKFAWFDRYLSGPIPPTPNPQ